MKLKQRVEDFRVRELLDPDVLVADGPWRVYRVIKRKLTSMQAAEVVAREAGCATGEVSMCGFKDRQGVTVQHMAVHHGSKLDLRGDDLRIESIGYAATELDSKASRGNAFDVIVRGLTKADVDTLRANLTHVREQGLINYFDDQRFGNLRHGQGWIALDLMRGEIESALRTLLTAASFHDDPRTKSLKRALRANWGDWSVCRDIAGKFGAHHSVFEHLKRHQDDFAGAFYHVSSRLRLIHLYAYQSHLWNRAVVELVRERAKAADRIVVESEEGPLVYPSDNTLLGVPQDTSFVLPGNGFEGVELGWQRELLADALAVDRLVPSQFRVEGVSGFQLKAEPRPLFVVPEHLRVRPAQTDPLNRGLSMVDVRFELPRGAYATLVVRRLLATAGRASFLERPATFEDDRSRPPLGLRRARGEFEERRGPRDDRGRRDDRREPRGERAPRFARDERPPHFERDQRRERAPRFERSDRADRAPRQGRDERIDRSPRFQRDERAPRRPYAPRDDRGSPPRGYGSRDERPPRRPYGERGGRGPTRPYGEREDRGPKRPYAPRDDRGRPGPRENRPWRDDRPAPRERDERRAPPRGFKKARRPPRRKGE